MNQRFLVATLLALQSAQCRAFTPARFVSGSHSGISRQQVRMHASTTEDASAVSSMRAGEIKKELQSYGISTAAFLEKSELVDALVDARAKGLQPKASSSESSQTSESSSKSSSSTQESTAAGSSSSEASDARPRDERLKEEMEGLKSMKAGEMKKELEQRGISTASFFEKSEFLKALAEARVDNVQNNGGGQKKKKRRSGDSNGEGYAEYNNVEVITDDSAGPRQKSSGDSSSSAGASPFGGAAPGGMGGMGLEDLMGMMGGMGGAGGAPGGMPGGMGGIADMLKNMGGMGGMGGGAAGGSPFGGDMMGKAQEMMKNPKVMEIMMKAQSNPKMMAAMQECMSNPAAFAKYRNDPEVSELIRELEKYI